MKLPALLGKYNRLTINQPTEFSLPIDIYINPDCFCKNSHIFVITCLMRSAASFSLYEPFSTIRSNSSPPVTLAARNHFNFNLFLNSFFKTSYKKCPQVLSEANCLNPMTWYPEGNLSECVSESVIMSVSQWVGVRRKGLLLEMIFI